MDGRMDGRTQIRSCNPSGGGAERERRSMCVVEKEKLGMGMGIVGDQATARVGSVIRDLLLQMAFRFAFFPSRHGA